MSNTTTIRSTPTVGFIDRVMAAIDRALMASARTAVRKGDLPYFGL
jgi:hypothetical protein